MSRLQPIQLLRTKRFSIAVCHLHTDFNTNNSMQLQLEL